MIILRINILVFARQNRLAFFGNAFIIIFYLKFNLESSFSMLKGLKNV
jgi:hypothetical protein